jgi:hypothetical protein
MISAADLSAYNMLLQLIRKNSRLWLTAPAGRMLPDD